MKKTLLLILFLSIGIISQLPAQTVPFNPEVATQHYLDLLSPEQKAKSDAYFEGGYWLLLWNVLYAIGIGYVFLSLGLSNWIKNIAFKVKNVNLQNLIYGLLYLVFAWLLSFPLDVYQNYFREHQYALSNLSFMQWLGENLKGFLLSTIAMSLLLVGIYKAVRKTGNNWWLWGASIFIVFLVIIMFIAPVFISPIFNKYQPLPEGPLKSQILSLARANNIPADNVYQFDASKQSKRISANVSGIATTTRISLNDNLLNRSTTAEIKAVMGHEMGHYVLNHVYKGLLEFGLLIVIIFAFIHWSFQKIISRKGQNFGITNMSDIGGLPLVIVLISVATFVLTPIANTITRTQEIEADMFGLNAAREPDGFANIAMKLSEYRKINPGYWEEIFFFDHPSGHYRVLSAMKWKAENLEEKKTEK